MKTVSCEDGGHGRLPWMGHVQCTSCERLYKHQPPNCRAMKLIDGVYVVCGGTVFRAACAKCFTSEQIHNGFDGSTSGDSTDDSSGNFFAPGCGD